MWPETIVKPLQVRLQIIEYDSRVWGLFCGWFFPGNIAGENFCANHDETPVKPMDPNYSEMLAIAKSQRKCVEGDE